MVHCGTRTGRSKCHTRSSPGFTLIEVMIVTVIIGALAALAGPNLQRTVERARVVKAIGDIDAIQQNCQEFFLLNGSYPPSLADVGMGGLLDPFARFPTSSRTKVTSGSANRRTRRSKSSWSAWPARGAGPRTRVDSR